MKGVAMLLLAVALALPATASHPEAYASQESASYYFAYGEYGSGHLALGSAYDGQNLVPFEGCLFAQLRPGLDHGRIHLLGLLENRTTLDLNIDGYSGGDAKQGGIATNVTLDGTLDLGVKEHPEVTASAAAWGVATGSLLTAGAIMPVNFTDPVGGGETLSASMFVGDDGYRDDATNGIPLAQGNGWYSPTSDQAAKLDKGNAEMHLRLRTPADASPTSDEVRFASEGDLPDGSMSPNMEHAANLPFANSKFGGHGKAHLTASANAPPGLNAITFSIISPLGMEVGNATLTPSLGADAQQDIEFPLDHFGSYLLAVHGKVALAKYAAVIALDPPASLDMNLWWDHVQFGESARGGINRCIKAFSEGAGSAAPVTVGRAKPPGFPLEAVVLSVVVAAATVLVITKMLSHSRATSSFRKTARK